MFLEEQHYWGAGRIGLPWSGCSLRVDSSQASASHCPCLAPTPPHGRLGQATVSRPFIFKIPVVFPPQTKGAVPATDPPSAWAWAQGPEAVGGGASGHPAAAEAIRGGLLSQPAFLSSVRRPLGCRRTGPRCSNRTLYVKSSGIFFCKANLCFPTFHQICAQHLGCINTEART